MQSDTPRTDANVINVDYETIAPDGEPSLVIEEVVRVDFARQLERELANAKAQLVTKTDELAAMSKMYAAVTIILEEMQRDAEGGGA